MSMIVPSSHTRIGAWGNSKMQGRNPLVYCTISLTVMQEYRTNTEYTGSLGYHSVCYITSKIGWVSLQGIYRYRYRHNPGKLYLLSRRVNRSKGQARLDYILTKKADRRLICCVNVRRSTLKAPESNHDLVYA